MKTLRDDAPRGRLPWTHQRDRGFTLVELLVAVIIVGVLAAVAVPMFLRQRDKAAAGVTKANVRSAHSLIITARENTKQTLRDITGSNCSTCACRANPAVPMLKVTDAAFAASTCGARWTAVAQGLATASGESLESTKRVMTDGWGYPLTVDENEADPTVSGICGVSRDQIYSAGPNHTLRTPPAVGAGWDEPDDTMTWVNQGGHC